MFKVVANNSQVSGGFLARTTTLEEVTHIRRHLLDHIAANICELHLIFVINYHLCICIWVGVFGICDRCVEGVTHIRRHILDHIATNICEWPTLSFILLFFPTQYCVLHRLCPQLQKAFSIF